MTEALATFILGVCAAPMLLLIISFVRDEIAWGAYDKFLADARERDPIDRQRVRLRDLRERAGQLEIRK